MRHFGVLFEQFVSLLFGHKRVHEERAGTAHFAYCRELGHTGLDDFLARFGCLTGRNVVDNGCNDITALEFVLESAVSIAKSALFVGEDAVLKCLCIKGIDTNDDVFRFDAIGSDILYRGSPYLTGNETQFLHSGVAHVGELGDEVIETETVLRLNRFIIEETRTCHTGMQDDTVEVLGKQQVRALTNMENLLAFMGFEHVT